MAGDWRERLKARAASPEEPAGAGEPQSQPKSEGKKARSEAKKLRSDEKPDLAELSKGLPEGWKALWDPKQQQAYFGNTRTKVSSRG